MRCTHLPVCSTQLYFLEPFGLTEASLIRPAPFIKSCPSTNPPLGLKAFPPLTITAKDLIAGQKAQLSFKSTGTAGPLHLAFIGSAGTKFVAIDSKKRVVIPRDLDGTNYAVVTTASSGAVTDDVVVAGPAVFDFGLTSSARQ